MIAATETARALAHMTPRTRELVTPQLLDKKLGMGTVAGGLNDQLRYRVVGSGAPSTRQLVPDNELTEQFAASPAGPRLDTYMRTALASTDATAGVAKIKGFIFPEDTQAAAAGAILNVLDVSSPAERGRIRRKDSVDTFYNDIRGNLKNAGAWHYKGWLTIAPDTTRALLTGIGAYTPHASQGEARLRRGRWADYINEVGVHELQHSVSPRPQVRTEHLRWMEEGTASLLSELPQIKADTTRRTGINAHSYAGHVGAPDSVDLEWGPWKRPTFDNKREASDTQKSNQTRYQDGPKTLVKLLKLAGADVSTKAGIERARHILQDQSVLYTPGRIADEIIEHNGLKSSARERLHDLVVAANSSREAMQRVREFVAAG